jgi:putative transposase
MPRLPRLFLAGQPNHVIQRGNNRGAIFFAEDDRRRYLAWLGEALASEGCALHAYVLMTNHVHLLVTAVAEQAIPRVLQSLGRRYVRHVNQRYGRSGTLWEGRFKSTIVDSETYLLACHRYIESNPLRARMVADAADYRWSSYRHNALGEADALLTRHAVYEALGGSSEARCAAYRALFREGLEDPILATIRDATQRGWAMGSERFQQEIGVALRRRADPPQRGRPRKPRLGEDSGPATDQHSK